MCVQMGIEIKEEWLNLNMLYAKPPMSTQMDI